MRLWFACVIVGCKPESDFIYRVMNCVASVGLSFRGQSRERGDYGRADLPGPEGK
jgi:hypothetical protein